MYFFIHLVFYAGLNVSNWVKIHDKDEKIEGKAKNKVIYSHTMKFMIMSS
jgi:hypothetical protein